MKNKSKKFLFGLLFAITLAALVACDSTSPLNLKAKDFALERVPLLENREWKEEVYQSNEGETSSEVDYVDFWNGGWITSGVNGSPASFDFQVSHFNSIGDAKRDYQRAVQNFKENGFTHAPWPGLDYKNESADQSQTFCLFPEPPGGACFFLARYYNYVMIVSICTDLGLDVDEVTAILKEVERHVTTVIASSS